MHRTKTAEKDFHTEKNCSVIRLYFLSSENDDSENKCRRHINRGNGNHAYCQFGSEVSRRPVYDVEYVHVERRSRLNIGKSERRNFSLSIAASAIFNKRAVICGAKIPNAIAAAVFLIALENI